MSSNLPPLSALLPSLLTLSVATAVVATLATTSGPDPRVVARTGQPAPGAPAGAQFTAFGSAIFDGAPAIGADGTVAFAGMLADGTTGFWIDRGAGVELLALAGTHAPGTGPGVVFRQRLAEIVIVAPPLLVPGHAVLHDTLAGPGIGFDDDEGLWHSDGTGLALVLREGAPAPGLANVRLAHPVLRALDAAGRAVVSCSLAGAVVAGNDESVWRVAPDATLELLAREGSAAPGAGFGVVFAEAPGRAAFPLVLGNAAGDVLFATTVHGPGTNDDNDEALYVRDGAGTRLLLREGDPVPGTTGFAVHGGAGSFHSSRVAFAGDGRVAVTAEVASAGGTATVVLTDANGSLAPVVRSGDPAPGGAGTFDLFGAPFLNAPHDLAFLASTSPGAAHPPFGAWIAANGVLRAIVLPGQQLAGEPVVTMVQDVRSIVGFDDAGSLLLTADLGVAGVAASSSALLLANRAGAITVLARTGGRLALGPGDLRTVDGIGVRRGALGGGGVAAFVAHFADGSSAELVAGALDGVERVAAGTPGKGGFVPVLAVQTIRVGTSGTIAVTNATGGAPGVLGIAFPDDPSHPERFATFALGCGSALLARTAVLVPSILSGAPGAAGAGTFALPHGPLDASLLGTTWYLQAAYVDPAAPCGSVALTEIVRITIR